MNKTGIIILAAGPSTRLGKPKQLLVHHGKTLIEHICSEALQADLHPVLVVTGAASDQVSKALESKAVEIVFNEQWNTGMASGIAAGLSELLKADNGIESVIIAVCDQPFVSADLFKQLIKTKAEGSKGMVGCAYAGIIGTPVLFGKAYFGKLLALKGNEGAKKILKTNSADLAGIPFEEGNIDIDTQEDYKQLISSIR
jgi:molybdenum cofactor cytidylyltransferase